MRRGLIELLMVMLTAAVYWQAVQAQPRIEAVELGFNGRFFPGSLTPLAVSLSNSGAAQIFTLEVSQEVREITERSSVERLRLPVHLSRGARKTVSFDFLIRSVSAPVQIRLFADGRELASTALQMRERWSEVPLTLGLGVDNLELIEPEKLPTRWTSYDGVGRLLWGRLDPGRLSLEQREALHAWLLQGGHLIILTGENWYEQTSTGEDWWSRLLPITHGRPVLRALDGRQVLWVEGTMRPGARVAERAHGLPMAWERPIGEGKVVLVAVATLPKEIESLQSANIRETAEQDRMITKALGALIVPFPSREVIGALLILFVVGFGLGGIFVTRWKRLPLWVALSSVAIAGVLVGYGHSPEFSRARYVLDLGVLRGWQGEPFFWEQSWYGVFLRHAQDVALGVSGDLVRTIGGSAWMELAREKSLRFWGERESAHFFHAQRMVKSFVLFSLDEASLQVRISNRASAALQDVVVHWGGALYRLGTIAAGAELVRSLRALVPIPPREWLEGLSERRRMLANQWGSGPEGLRLMGWLEDSSLWAKASGEARTVLRLVVVEGT